MVSVLSFNRSIGEQKCIEASCRNEVALRSNDGLRFMPASTCAELQKVIKEGCMIDLIYYEIEDEPDIDCLKRMREEEPTALLALITRPQISPALYLRPRIAPMLLLLRPLQPERLAESNAELFENFFSEQNDRISDRCFVLKSREGRTLLPYGKIAYFEARNKKINVRIGDEEYDFYGSLEAIEEQVPDYFAQCHRAYLVNVKKIARLHMADNLIELHSGEMVPLSRTYRKVISEMVR